MHPDDYMIGEVDARIYVRNVPTEYNEDFLRGIVTQYGSATKVDLLQSRLINGRRSGFIHMTSHRSAMQAIEAIRRTRLPNSDEHLEAKLQNLQPVRCLASVYSRDGIW